MARALAEIAGGIGSLIGVVFFGVALLISFALPYLVWSIASNIRQIRIQLERIGDSLAANPPRPIAPQATDVFQPNRVERIAPAAARPGRLGI